MARRCRRQTVWPGVIAVRNSERPYCIDKPAPPRAQGVASRAVIGPAEHAAARCCVRVIERVMIMSPAGDTSGSHRARASRVLQTPAARIPAGRRPVQPHPDSSRPPSKSHGMRWSCEWFGGARRTGRPVSSLTLVAGCGGLTAAVKRGSLISREPLAGTIVHTHGGISRPFQTCVCAAHGDSQFSEQARRCP
jgi:hypothetical protein